MNKPSILLTGATGFLGSKILNALSKEKYSIILLKRSTSSLWRINHLTNNIKSYDILQKVKINEKIIGIGESGLDYYYKNSDIDIQKKNFVEHIKASQESNLPLIVHTRSAESDTYEILKSEIKNKKLKVLIHCFTGSKEFAKKLLDIGCFISASGIVTFKNSKDLAETFKFIPNERILVETDSPYLSPDPLRGKINEPCNIIYTLKFLSKIKNLDEESFAKTTTENFFKLFGELR